MRTISIATTTLALGLALGCAPAAGQGDGHEGHAHEIPTIQVTTWSDRLETFSEHPAPVAGQPTRFVVHCSLLPSGAARTSGEVRISAEREGAPPITATAPVPDRPGVWIPVVTFPSAGDWHVRLHVPLENGEEAADLGTVTVHADVEGAAHGEHPEPPEGIAFRKEAQWRLGTTAEPAERRTVIERLRVAGHVVPRPGGRAVVVPPVAGRWVPTTPPLAPGDRVTAGQLLGHVVPPLAAGDLVALAVARAQAEEHAAEVAFRRAEAESAVAKAEAAAAQAGRALARVRGLRAEDARAVREVEEAEGADVAARAELTGARAQRAVWHEAATRHEGVSGLVEGLDGYPAVPVAAPIAGICVAADAVPGAHVGPEHALFAILDPSIVHVEADVPEAAFGRLPAEPAAALEAPGGLGAVVEIAASGGRLVRCSPEVEPASRTVAVVYELPNPTGAWRPGGAVTVHVATATATEALAVPVSALVDEDGRPVVYVQLGGETFARRELVLGARDAGFVEVRDGVAEGERVVSRGAYFVRLAAVAPAAAGHGHAH